MRPVAYLLNIGHSDLLVKRKMKIFGEKNAWEFLKRSRFVLRLQKPSSIINRYRQFAGRPSLDMSGMHDDH